jgi:hypothetical protein
MIGFKHTLMSIWYGPPLSLPKFLLKSNVFAQEDVSVLFKTNAETDLALLHYVNFIESLAVFPTEALSFNSKQFKNNFVKEVIEGELNDPFILLEEHFFTVVLLYNKNYGVQFKDLW